MISILCPSRGRPTGARELLDTIRATSTTYVELIFRLDDDDPSLADYYDQASGSDVQFIVGPRIVLSACWNEAAEKAEGDILMQCGDDIRFRTIDWDRAVSEQFDTHRDKILLVHGRDGIQDDRVATHGFLHRRWMETVGYFVPPIFASDYNDLWLTEVADALGRRVYLPAVYTEHMHPVAHKAEYDLTHQERLTRHREQDCDALYRNTADQRATDVARLWSVINTPEEKQ